MDDTNGHSPDGEVRITARGPIRTEQRRCRRIPLEAIVHYQVNGSEFINLSSNVSAEGIFIRNFSPPAVGTELRIRVHLPQDRGGVPVQLTGRVVRVVDEVGVDERGMGVKFESVQADTREAVRYFVSEVYELDHLERLEMEIDGEGGRFRYVPRPEDVLRLESDDGTYQAGSEELGRSSRYRILRGVLLLLVGVLLGGGFVFLFFLLD